MHRFMILMFYIVHHDVKQGNISVELALIKAEYMITYRYVNCI